MSLTAANIAGSNSSRGREANDYYATPPTATRLILDRVPLGDDTILEPSAGEGHIVKVLKEYYPHNQITANDLIWRESRIGENVTGGIDFLEWQPDCRYDTVITNPPFTLAQPFVEKALSIANHYVIIFAKLAFLETVERKKLFGETPLKYVYVHSRRVSPWRNGDELDEKGKPWASPMAFAWFVWEIGYKGEPMVRWL